MTAIAAAEDPTKRFLSVRDSLLARQGGIGLVDEAIELPVLERFNWATDFFDVVARDNDAPALIIARDDGIEARATFRDLARRSDQAANWLLGLGVERGDRILLMTGNVLPLWEIMLAAMKIGAVLIPASTLLRRAELQDRLERGRVRVVVTQAAHVPELEDAVAGLIRVVVDADIEGWFDYRESHSACATLRRPAVTRAADTLFLYFTSGTTSKPKLVEHTHASYPVGHLSTMYWLGCRPGDIHLNLSAPGWAKHAWSSFFAPWNAGATVLGYQYDRFSAASVLELLERERVTTFCAPPTVWRAIVQSDFARRRLALREATSAGEPLNPEVIVAIRSAWGITVRDGFGQTETTAQLGNPPGRKLKPGSMGTALPGYRVTLLDADGHAADMGEICIDLASRPVGLMSGYVDDPELNSQVFRGGYYHTADIAERDADGYFFYVGRADDVFKSSDYRISPFELESVLIEHPAVAEAAVVPAPDPLRLAVPKAIVTLAPGAVADRETALRILAHVSRRVAPFKRVRRIEFAPLPKTVSGKIRRGELRRLEVERAAAGRRADNEFDESEDYVC